MLQHVHLEGKRFSEGALPLSATTELQRFQYLLERVAKSLYLADHPNRHKVRTEALGILGFDLAITRLGKGSVTVDLGVRRSATTPITQGDDYLERARRLIEEAFADLSESETVPQDFPQELVPDLALMGVSLKEGETLTWAHSKRQAPKSRAVLTNRTTEPIRGFVPDKSPQERLLHVYVVGVCSSPLEFTYQFEAGERSLRGQFSNPDIFHQLREVCGFAKRTPLVALTVMRNRTGDRKVVDVLNVEALLPSEWSSRLEELSALPDGWLDGEGRAVSKEALQTAEAFLFMVLDAGVSRPGVYPTPDGGIQMEWAEGPEELEVLVAKGGSIRIYFDEEEPDGFVGTPALVFSRAREALGK